MACIEFEELNDMCVYGLHIYNNVWRPVIREELRYQRDEDCDKSKDPYDVAVTKSCTGVIRVKVVGHILHYFSSLCCL